MLNMKAAHANRWLTLATALLVAGVLLLAGGTARAADFIPDTLFDPVNPEGNAACLECHVSPDTMMRDGQEISIHVDPLAYEESVHGILSCTRCHAEAGPEHAADPTKPLGLPTGRELRMLKSEGCVKCHAGTYEQSYNESFHGIAIANGDERSATCVDCHGTHNILPASDPLSMVAPNRVAETCGQCHVNAPESFADGTEHFVASDAETAGGLNLLYKAFMGLLVFDTMKDGPIVMFELLRRLTK